MKIARDIAEDVYNEHLYDYYDHSKENEVSRIESALIKYGNQKLEQAAKITEQRCGTSTIAVKEIRALKETGK